MPPQNSAVIDDEYGLEPAKAAKTASEDEYGLEPAGKTEKPDFTAAKARVAQPTEFEKAAGNQSIANYNQGLGENETPLEKIQRGHAGLWDVIKHAANPASPYSDTSETLGKIGDVAQRKAEEAHTEALKRVAQGEKPSSDLGSSKADWLDLAARTAHMASGATEPGNVALAGGAIVAPEIVGPALLAHGGYGTYKAAQDISENGLTPENAEAGLGSLSEMAGGAAGTAEGVHRGFKNTATGKVLDKAIRGTPLTEAGKIEAAKRQALAVKQPGVKETDYAQKFTEALPDLQTIARDNSGQLKTPRQGVEAIENHVDKIEGPIGEHLRNLPRTGANMVAPEDVASNVNKAIDDHVADPRSDHYSGKEVEKARNDVHELIGDQPKSVADLEKVRRRLNKDAQDYYRAKKTGATSNVASDAEAAFKAAAADSLRDMLYGTEAGPGLIEKAGIRINDAQGNPIDIRSVRQRVGNLLDIRNHFRDAITRAEQTGDWSALKAMSKGPSLAIGGLGGALGFGLGGPLGSPVGLAIGEGLKAVHDYKTTKNPNLNVQKMFRNLENTGTGVSSIPKISAVTPPQPAEQIPINLPPENAPLFNIQQTPRLRPDFEEPRLGTISGEQVPLNIPAHGEAPLFSLPQTEGTVPTQPKIPQMTPAQGLEAETGGIPKVKTNFRGTQENVVPAEEATAKMAGKPANLKPGESTSDRFFNKETKQWTPERMAQADAFIESQLKGKVPPKGRPPEATITMGGTGAGKSSLTRPLLEADPNLVDVNSDKTKLAIPEYEGLKKSDPQNAAFRVHDESSMIAKRLLRDAAAKGLDFVYDTTTGGSDPELYKRLQDAGYKVKIAYVDIPVEEALRRAAERSKNSIQPENRGRDVPEDIAREKHQESAQKFLDLQNHPNVDEVHGFDNSGKKPVEFYTKDKSGETIHDEKKMQQVREKSKVGAVKAGTIKP